MMALAAVFPLGIDGHHVHRSQFPVVCQVRGDEDDDEKDWFLHPELSPASVFNLMYDN